MRLSTILVTAAVAGLLASAAAAQETTATPETTTPPASTAPETAAPAETTAPAQPAPADQNFPLAAEEQPREMLKATFDDWQVRCATAAPDRCFMFQLVRDPNGTPDEAGNKPAIAEFTMIKLPEGGQAAAGATIVTPLGVLLTRGIALTIDQGQPLGYPYLYCTPQGCFSRLGLTAATVTRMKKGALASVTLFGINAPDKPVAGTLSLKGFTAAFDSLTPVVPPQQP